MSNPTSSLRERVVKKLLGDAKEFTVRWLDVNGSPPPNLLTAIEQLVADEQKALLHRLHHTEDPATHHCDCLRFQIDAELAKLGKEQGNDLV